MICGVTLLLRLRSDARRENIVVVAGKLLLVGD